MMISEAGAARGPTVEVYSLGDCYFSCSECYQTSVISQVLFDEFGGRVKFVVQMG